MPKMRVEYEIWSSINGFDEKRKKSKECNLMYEALSALNDAFHCNKQKRRNIDLMNEGEDSQEESKGLIKKNLSKKDEGLSKFIAYSTLGWILGLLNEELFELRLDGESHGEGIHTKFFEQNPSYRKDIVLHFGRTDNMGKILRQADDLLSEKEQEFGANAVALAQLKLRYMYANVEKEKYNHLKREKLKWKRLHRKNLASETVAKELELLEKRRNIVDKPDSDFPDYKDIDQKTLIQSKAIRYISLKRTLNRLRKNRKRNEAEIKKCESDMRDCFANMYGLLVMYRKKTGDNKVLSSTPIFDFNEFELREFGALENRINQLDEIGIENMRTSLLLGRLPEVIDIVQMNDLKDSNRIQKQEASDFEKKYDSTKKRILSRCVGYGMDQKSVFKNDEEIKSFARKLGIRFEEGEDDKILKELHQKKDGMDETLKATCIRKYNEKGKKPLKIDDIKIVLKETYGDDLSDDDYELTLGELRTINEMYIGVDDSAIDALELIVKRREDSIPDGH